MLDPNNNLLVDTDYDPETKNVTINEFTSNIIRFTFNPDSTSNLNFEFFATNINGLTFKHEYSTTNSGESVFVPNVYVYDYVSDSGELVIINDSPSLIAVGTLGLSLILIFKLSLKVNLYSKD